MLLDPAKTAGLAQSLIAVAGLDLFIYIFDMRMHRVRAGIVKDPKVYRWSGYAETVAKGGLAVDGLFKLFVERMFNEHNGEFSKLRRKRGANQMKGGEWGDLCAACELRSNVVSFYGC